MKLKDFFGFFFALLNGAQTWHIWMNSIKWEASIWYFLKRTNILVKEHKYQKDLADMCQKVKIFWCCWIWIVATQGVTDTERSLNNSILNLQYLSTAGCRDQIFWGYSCWEDAETLLHGLNSWKRTSLARMLDEFLHLPFPNWWAFLSCKLIPSGNTFPIFVQKIKFCNKKTTKNFIIMMKS